MSSVEQNKEWDRMALRAATTRMGEFAWPTVIYGVAVVVAYWVVVALVLLGEINIWLGALLCALATYLPIRRCTNRCMVLSRESIRGCAD